MLGISGFWPPNKLDKKFWAQKSINITTSHYAKTQVSATYQAMQKSDNLPGSWFRNCFQSTGFNTVNRN